ncbi:helix-turn-helix domain-containing protein [Nocardioides gansuensis]|uniref:Helix-turn-helix domain-containing protein n=1 Tax=Nocardioides gansuensis TaxID=2138300 RepID=A0A2T8FE84_9ACTN|nr:helix-turn-helix domain-containing protein [Nocardioides gansuensis]
MPRWLSIERAAGLLDVSTKTIRRLIASGDLPAYRCGKRGIRIKTTDLESIMRPIPSAKLG